MKNYKFEYSLFQKFITKKPFSVSDYIIALLKIPKDILEFSIRYIPGPIGFKLRYFYYKLTLKKIVCDYFKHAKFSDTTENYLNLQPKKYKFHGFY